MSKRYHHNSPHLKVHLVLVVAIPKVLRPIRTGILLFYE